MVAYFPGGLLPFLVLLAVVVVAAAWWLLVRCFGRTRLGRHAAPFLDVGDAELPPEERVKNTSHPGAGGHG